MPLLVASVGLQGKFTYNKTLRIPLLKGSISLNCYKPISMQKNTMYFDTHRTKICKDIYRPSSNLVRLFKTVVAVLMSGSSPISHSALTRKKMH